MKMKVEDYTVNLAQDEIRRATLKHLKKGQHRDPFEQM